MTSIHAHVDSFLPGMFNASGEFGRLPAGALARVQAFGRLVLGEPTVFAAIVTLTRRHPSLRRLLAGKATPLGRAIDDALLEHHDDPFFATIPVFRPDLMVTDAGQVYAAELEIVVGDLIHLGIVQRFFDRRPTVVDRLLAALRDYARRFATPGAPALLFDDHGAPLVAHHALIESRFDRHAIVARLSELTFRDDGVYRRRTRIGAAYVFLKNHKLARGCQPEGERLIRAWLARQVVLAPPPSLLLDNKILLWVLTAPRYTAELAGLLGRDRLDQLRSYLPRSWLVDASTVRRSATVRAIVEQPWRRGRFVFKFPSLWGSRDIAVSPTGPSPRWQQRIARMLRDTEAFGPLVCQEAIETFRLSGRTKVVPFFFRTPSGDVECADVGLYRMPGPWAVHRTPASCLAIVGDG